MSDSRPKLKAAERRHRFRCLECAHHLSSDENTSAKSDETSDGDKTSISDWEIPPEDINLSQELGRGQFGPVYRAHWHGQVVVKMFDIHSNLSDSKRLLEFKKDVSVCSKARHANVALFLGACTARLAIVTERCNGISIHKLLHVFKIHLTLSQLVSIAQQICRGMSYLHGRKILHKDLRPKNCFVECQHWKLVVTDFGFFDPTKLYRENKKCLQLPPGWVAYLAPELVTKLTPVGGGLEFSKGTDVYAFGTIWFELCCGQMAFAGYEVATIFWQVGAGLKAPTNIQLPRLFKDILMACWSGRVQDRPGFGYLEHILGEVPLQEICMLKLTSRFFQF